MVQFLAYGHKKAVGRCPKYIEMAIFHTGGVFSYLPHHLDLALEDSVGHSTCMSVLARRRAIMGLGLGLGLGLGYHGVVGGFLAVG